MILQRGAVHYEVDKDCALKDPSGRAWIFTQGETLPDWVDPQEAAALLERGVVTKFGVI
ncbi:hypothetical protein [Nocardioides sp. cx-173]|uniref:hypothetical protein n=1 Tax=Nocardioides sp. cx-173 TaxID=2898796 RepID=UPI001E427408|nr:hypothetical protein [Nocardioides sp. cx-173]MCD4525237.1 hypothetical protein [Nocardioides sp. cx-173]UGB40960.1 hypothetical protein LQ940_16480 [Nocardioides sp. cx-173]